MLLDELQLTMANLVLFACNVCRIYLMKQIVRQFSVDILKQISDVRQVRWLIPHHDRQDQVRHSC